MNHVKDMMLKLNPKTVYGGPILKMEGLSKCRYGRCSPCECHLTNTDLVLDHKQALEHSKPPMFSNYQLESFYVGAEVLGVDWNHLLIYLPCPYIYIYICIYILYPM